MKLERSVQQNQGCGVSMISSELKLLWLFIRSHLNGVISGVLDFNNGCDMNHKNVLKWISSFSVVSSIKTKTYLTLSVLQIMMFHKTWNKLSTVLQTFKLFLGIIGSWFLSIGFTTKYKKSIFGLCVSSQNGNPRKSQVITRMTLFQYGYPLVI